MKCVGRVFASICYCLMLLREAHTAMPCVSQTLALSLDDSIHISDVVLTGRVTEMRKGDWGTHTAAITYYYAYKSDRFLVRLGFGRIEVKNFPSAVAMREGALFFLTREPNKDLALLCMAPLSALSAPREMGFSNMYEVLERVRTVGEDDNSKNRKFVPPTPNPCDSGDYCSAVGSYCTVTNTLPGEMVRCVCLTGYVGDGRNCTAIGGRTEATPTTAPPSECPQCSYGAHCLRSSSAISCDCSHLTCTDAPLDRVCGSNGETYDNRCQLMLAACQLQQPIFWLHNGSCEIAAVRPCGGLSLPLTSPSGVVGCGSPLLTCPPLHFCHSTELYNICCPVTPPETSSREVQPTPTPTSTTHTPPPSTPSTTYTPAPSTTTAPDVTRSRSSVHVLQTSSERVVHTRVPLHPGPTSPSVRSSVRPTSPSVRPTSPPAVPIPNTRTSLTTRTLVPSPTPPPEPSFSGDMSGDGSGDFGRERRGSGEGSVDGTMVDDEDFVPPQLRRFHK